MIDRAGGAQVAARLHGVQGVVRVVITGRDGVPVYDDESLSRRLSGAATAAVLAGAALATMQGYGLNTPEIVVAYAAQAHLLVRELPHGQVLVVVVDSAADMQQVFRAVIGMARELRAAQEPPVGE